MSRTFTRMAAAALVTLGSASFAMAQTAAPTTQKTVTATTNMQAAPDATVHLHAPGEHRCGIFETCANTKIGLGKGDFIVRLSALGVITNNTGSRVKLNPNSTANQLAGGRADGTYRHSISATNQVMPELTLEYFFTDHLSIDLIASSTRHEAQARAGSLAEGGSPVARPGGKLDVGSFWVLPPTLTMAYHFRPHKRFNPYAGLGITVAIFHNAGAAHNIPGVFDSMHVKTNVGPSFNLGFDYQLVGNWFFNFDVKQILLLNTAIRLNHRNNLISGNPGTGHNGRIRVHDDINPTVVGAGIEYRF